MAAINFVKGEQYYTAEFQINGPVNVHIERAEAGALYFRQRSIDHGSYDLINGANWNNRGDLTIDTAIQGVVYPMWIKIESASEPTLAEMVEGESSGGGAGTESTMEYLDVSGLDKSSYNFGILARAAQLIRVVANNTIAVGTYGITTLVNADTAIANITSIAIDFKTPIISQGQLIDIETFVSSLYSSEELAAIPHLTKEQFYNLSSEEDSGDLQEGDVLYYSCPSTITTDNTLKDLIKIKDNIVTVAAANAENPNTGSITPIKSFINGENLEWYENTTYGYVGVSTSNYSSLDIIGFSFKVGSDLKTALDIVGTPIGGEITQITQEEYENIFNS